MRVRVVVTDEGGRTFEGEVSLVAVDGARPSRHDSRRSRVPSRTSLDFSLPARAFMKRHAKGLSGPQKFTLLLARLSGGKVGAAVNFKDIEKSWNRMTEPMGGRFNPAYTTRAKDSGWVDTTKTGHYALRSSWAEALGR